MIGSASGAVQVFRNGRLLRQGADFTFSRPPGKMAIVSPLVYSIGDQFSVVFPHRLSLSTTINGVAVPYVSYQQWIENWACAEGNTPPDSSVRISCKSGIVKVGTDITAAAQTQEIEIMNNVPGSQRWEQIQLCITDRFLGQTRVTASMGRPGTNHNEMTGTDVPMADSSGNAVCWTSRPTPGQFIGPYSVVIALNAWSKDPVSGAEIPGDLSKLTSGSLTWEACGYQGIIGNLNVAGQSTKPVILQCSGSDSHIDPVTGKTYVADCTGMLWAKLPGLSILGVLADVGPHDPASHQIWRPIPNYVK
jgi:hypothetical protein